MGGREGERQKERKRVSKEGRKDIGRKEKIMDKRNKGQKEEETLSARGMAYILGYVFMYIQLLNIILKFKNLDRYFLVPVLFSCLISLLLSLQKLGVCQRVTSVRQEAVLIG